MINIIYNFNTFKHINEGFGKNNAKKNMNSKTTQTTKEDRHYGKSYHNFTDKDLNDLIILTFKKLVKSKKYIDVTSGDVYEELLEHSKEIREYCSKHKKNKEYVEEILNKYKEYVKQQGKNKTEDKNSDDNTYKGYTDNGSKVFHKPKVKEKIIEIYKKQRKENTKVIDSKLIYDIFMAQDAPDLKDAAERAGMDEKFIEDTIEDFLNNEKSLFAIKAIYIVMIVFGALGGLLMSLRGTIIAYWKKSNKEKIGNQKLTQKQDTNSYRLLILSRVLLITGALGGALRTAVPLFKKYSEDVNDNDNDRGKNQYRK